MRVRLILCAVIASALMLIGGHAQADTAVQSITGGSELFPSFNLSTGWEFSLSSNILVTDLGYYDAGLDGLAASHDVGIFRVSDMSLLGSATVQQGTASTLVNGFRYESVSPFLLVPDRYVVAGINLVTDLDRVFATAITTAPEITYVQPRTLSSNTLAFPTTQETSIAIGAFGPNFMFEAHPVPAPAALPAGLALLGLLAAKRRRRTA